MAWALAIAALSLPRSGGPSERGPLAPSHDGPADVRPRLINVGLVSTGTGSFVMACRRCGIDALHAVDLWSMHGTYHNMSRFLASPNLQLDAHDSQLAKELG